MPLGIIGFILGIVLLGSASHGKSLHGILGFVAIILTFVAFILEFRFNASIKALALVRGGVLSLLLVVANVLFLTGFVDIQRISLCTVQLPDGILIAAAMNVASIFTVGTTIVAVKMYIKKWIGGESREMVGDGEKSSFKESIKIVRMD